MTDNTHLGKYFNQLSYTDRKELEQRMEQYRERLEAEGYELAIAESDGGLFGGVLVIDEESYQSGFLEDDGSVTWLSSNASGIGALGSAIMQNPTTEFENQLEK